MIGSVRAYLCTSAWNRTTCTNRMLCMQFTAIFIKCVSVLRTSEWFDCAQNWSVQYNPSLIIWHATTNKTKVGKQIQTGQANTSKNATEREREREKKHLTSNTKRASSSIFRMHVLFIDDQCIMIVQLFFSFFASIDIVILFYGFVYDSPYYRRGLIYDNGYRFLIFCRLFAGFLRFSKFIMILSLFFFFLFVYGCVFFVFLLFQFSFRWFSAVCCCQICKVPSSTQKGEFKAEQIDCSGLGELDNVSWKLHCMYFELSWWSQRNKKNK